MTYEEAIAHIRATERLCRGPRLPYKLLTTSAKQMADKALLLVARTGIDIHTPEAMGRLIGNLLQDGFLAEARELDAASRRWCGYDVNELICAKPWNGGTYTEPCPQCGTLITWIAPVLAVEDADAHRFA